MDSVNNELFFAEEEILHEKKVGKRGNASNTLAVISIVWNGVVLGITALRALLIPLGFLVSVAVAVLGFVLVMLWSLPLAMSVIVLPFLPILGALAAAAFVLGAIALELLPVGLVTAGLILAIVSAAAGKKKPGATVRRIALLMGIAGLAVTVVAGFPLMLNTLIACVPVIAFGVVCVVFFVQLIVIAISNSVA